MANFVDQIKEDIRMYQDEHAQSDLFKKDEWAFNFWILDKLYYVDPEIIYSQITDYSDDGVDAWVFHEEKKDLYLIQNKFYGEKTALDSKYVTKDFLVRSFNVLKNGSYSRSKELQDIYNRYCDDTEFYVHLVLYVTNDIKNSSIESAIKEFNHKNKDSQPHVDAEILYLSDIKEKFYGEIEKQTKNFEHVFSIINQKTVINFDAENYHMKVPVDAKYILASVKDLYKMFVDAKDANYLLFDRNIREFLGSTGINKRIIETLKDQNDRYNFCYYNNGITINCKKFQKGKTEKNFATNKTSSLTVFNPQIVNGCQTMNSIFAALNSLSAEELKEYDNVYVVCKLLQINDDKEDEQELYKKIVMYNNSQNSIRTQDFTKNQPLFITWQNEFLSRGFCLLVKPSDKNKFSVKFKGNNIEKLKDKYNKDLDKFGLSFSKFSDFCIPLDKFLQVIIAFEKGGYMAYTKKSTVLDNGSECYKVIENRLSGGEVTTDMLLNLYLLFKLAEEKRKSSESKRTPIPYYLIDCFAKYECGNRSYSKIMSMLSSKEQIDSVIDIYSKVSNAYIKKNPDYNKTIKLPVDYELIEEGRENYFTYH